MKSRYLAAAVVLMLTPASALAADAVRAEVARADGFVRLSFIWPESEAEAPISIETSVESQVLLIRFSREVELDVAPILNAAGAEVALARMDPDQRTLRLALKWAARTHVSRSYNVVAVDVLPPEAADPADVVSPRAAAELEAARRQAELDAAAANAPPLPGAPLQRLEVRRASSPAFDRIVFDWPYRTDYELAERDGAWVLRFSHDAEPDIGSLRADPPARLSSIEARHQDGRLEMVIVPAPGAAPRAFRERNSVIVDLSTDTGSDALLAQMEELAAQAAAEAAVAESQTAEMNAETPADAGAPQRLIDPLPASAEPAEVESVPAPELEAALAAAADPVPESGVVAVTSAELGRGVLIEFPWAGPVNAAAFRRGGAVWIVFDAAAALDVSGVQRGGPHVADVQAMQGEGYSAVRIVAPETTQISLHEIAGDGAAWTFALAEQSRTTPAPIRIERRSGDEDRAPLLAVLPGATPPVRLADPEVGDTLIVAPAPAPATGLLQRRDFLGFSILPSAHGLALETLSADLPVEAAAEGVWITPPQALAPEQTLAAGPSPALIQFAHDETAAAFEAGKAAIEREAAARGLPAQHMDVARFLLGRELAHEALGALALALEMDAQLASDAGFRALRGVAHALAGRLREAENDLSHAGLRDDSTAQLWRAWARTEARDWIEARRLFADAEAAIGGFSPQWRARFREAYARTALELNDLAAAREQLDRAGVEPADERTALRIALDAARWREAADQPDDALAAYEQLARSGDEEIEARAILAGARLKHRLGRSGTPELIETLEGLRWRWRGDDVELETIRTLGALYVAEGRDREGLEAMKAAVARFPNHPVSRAIFTEMMDMFAHLFLEGGADRLDPVEAVALYFQFSELTPAGSEGDRMIRRLSERLVAFDLLPKAAELLQHQVDNRLHEPRARAEVAADLALIYLMDRQPEAALRALRSTRVTQLSPVLAAERRIIEARALAELEAFDAALDLIAGDPSIEASRLRADIAWTRRDWPLAGERLEEMLADRWTTPGPIGAEDSAAAVRAAVAYSLAGDGDALKRLAERYGPLMQESPDGAAFAAVTQQLETSGLRLAEIADRAADTAALEAFLERRRDRLENHDAPRADIAPQAAAPSDGPAEAADVAATAG